MSRKIPKCVLSAIVILFMFVSLSAANAPNWDDKIGYDLYFYKGSGAAGVIKNVKILGFKEIGNKTFVVIQPFGFKLNAHDGYVSLDAVSAILPNQDFRVEERTEINVRY